MAIMAFVAVLLAGGGVVGISGIAMSNDALDATYRNRLEPVDMLWKITALMNENRAQIMLALQHNPANSFARYHEHPLTVHTDAVARNRDEITAVWAEFAQRELTPDERSQADKYAAARARYVNEGLVPARQALLDGQFDTANEILLTKVNPFYNEASGQAGELLSMIKRSARQEYGEAASRYVLIRNLGIGGTLAALLLVGVAALLLLKSIVTPLQRAIAHFNRISQGNLTDEIDISGRDEAGQVLTSLAAMQVHLRSCSTKSARPRAPSKRVRTNWRTRPAASPKSPSSSATACRAWHRRPSSSASRSERWPTVPTAPPRRRRAPWPKLPQATPACSAA